MQNLLPTVTPTAHQLHQEFVRLGGMRLKLKNKMLAILPEIYKSGIWKKYAVSIIEYAGKYGDIAKTTVIKRLRLEENLDNLPFLKAAIEKVGVHKVSMVAKIATPETDRVLANKLSEMSKLAVQSLSKELRSGQCLASENVNFCQQFDLGAEGQLQPCKAPAITKKIVLDEETTFLFLKLKAKLGKNMSDNEFLKIILEERARREFPELNTCESQKNREGKNRKSVEKSVTGDTFTIGESGAVLKFENNESRYIKAAQKRQVIQRTQGKCSYPNCNSPFEVLHHVDRYSECKNHNFVMPLCKIHHEFAHNNLIRDEKLNVDQWKLSVAQKNDVKISQADVLYRKYRKESLP